MAINFPIGFRLASPSPGSGGSLPPIVEKALASGYDEYQGALILVDGSDNYAACGADPSSVAAVALIPGGPDTSGFNILGVKEFPPGYLQGIAVANGVKFLAPYTGSLGTIGIGYGVVKDSDGVWKVDFTDTSHPVVTYLGVPDFSPALAEASEPLVLVSFLAAVVQDL